MTPRYAVQALRIGGRWETLQRASSWDAARDAAVAEWYADLSPSRQVRTLRVVEHIGASMVIVATWRR